MTPSVSPEADSELTEAALFYAREAGAELGLAFIESSNEQWRCCARNRNWAQLGETDVGCHCTDSRTA